MKLLLRPDRLPIKWHGLLDCETEHMDEATSKTFISLNLAEIAGFDPKMEEEISDKSFCYKVLTKRLEAVESANEVSFPVKTLCGAVLSNTPGLAVMWAYTLHYIRVAEGKKVNMEVLTNWFPNGYPTKRAIEEAWSAQKMAIIEPERNRLRAPMAPDNWVDYFEFWPQLPKPKEGS